MRRILKPWHFDVAIFLGLALFAGAYWYSVPRPVNQWILKSNGTFERQWIQVSEDDQSILLFATARVPFMQAKLTGVQEKRTIEKWSTTTGKLLESIPLDIPVEDRKTAADQEESITFNVHSSNSIPLIESVRSVSKTERVRRFYNALDGRGIGPDIVCKGEREIIWLLQHLSKDGHHWAIQSSLDNGQPTHLIDLTTGEKLRSFVGSADEAARPAFLTPSGKYYIQGWVLAGRKCEFEVFRTSTWENLGRFNGNDSNDVYFSGIYCIDDTSWAFTEMFRPEPTENALDFRLCFYRFDPAKKTLTPDHSHVLHGLESKSQLFVEPPFLLKFRTIAPPRQDNRILQTLEGWLARVGVYRDNSKKTSIQIDDLTTGQPLRHVSGLPFNTYFKSRDSRSLYSFNTAVSPFPVSSGRVPDYVLCQYQFYHYLWEPTLSWIQWLSWLLVIPWPLRYFCINRKQKARVPDLIGSSAMA